jgi:hypothetical protein
MWDLFLSNTVRKVQEAGVEAHLRCSRVFRTLNICTIDGSETKTVSEEITAFLDRPSLTAAGSFGRVPLRKAARQTPVFQYAR